MKILLSTLLAFSLPHFPGGRPVVSPSGQFNITCIQGAGTDPIHQLVIQDSRTHARSVFHRFERSAEVLWAPDSKHLVVTDYTGSSESLVKVFSIPITDQPKWIALPQQIEAAINGCDHIYVSAVRWQSSNTLLLNVYAYGQIPGPTINRNFTLTVPNAN